MYGYFTVFSLHFWLPVTEKRLRRVTEPSSLSTVRPSSLTTQSALSAYATSFSVILEIPSVSTYSG